MVVLFVHVYVCTLSILCCSEAKAKPLWLREGSAGLLPRAAAGCLDGSLSGGEKVPSLLLLTGIVRGSLASQGEVLARCI